jgi:hypothetical protein
VPCGARSGRAHLREEESKAMGKSKDKDTKKMVKKEALKTPKEKKEAKKLKKLEKQRG